jgi:hypothetical protein
MGASTEGAASVTARVTPALWTMEPLVAVTVKLEEDTGVPNGMATVMVVWPLPETVVGLKLAEAPAGSPVTEKDSAPVKPVVPVVLMV